MQFNIDDIKLIVGLGNPGKNYTLTRHNAGFMFVDELIKQAETLSDWSLERKFQAEIARVKLGTSSPWLAKPATGMNLSGRSVQAIAAYYHIEPNQIAVAFDDLDIPLGKSKVQFGKGPKVHNGISSIKQLLATDQFWHIRLGIENRTQKGNSGVPGMAYALSNFAPSERTDIKDVFKNIIRDKLLHVNNTNDN